MSPVRLSRALAPVLLAAGLAVPGAAFAAPPAGFVFQVTPDTLRASEDGLWELDVRIVNGTGRGVYGDSLVLVVIPAGASLDDARALRRPLLLPTESKGLSAGDSLVSRVSVAAIAAQARLEVRFHGHDLGGVSFESRGNLVASGSVLDGLYPGTLARAAGRDVELVKVPAAGGTANGSGVLILPGEGLDARDMLAAAVRLSRRGVSVVIAAAPGRGRSQGPDDFAGPASRAGALAALDTLLGMPGVSPSRVGAWGVSRGATLALLLAIEKPAAFRAVAAQAACYDLHAAHRAAPPEARAAIESAAGRDSVSWRARSPLLRPQGLGAPVLVYHGERDAVFPAASAHAFVLALEQAGKAVVPRFLPNGEHDLPYIESVRFLLGRFSAPE